MYDGSIHSEDDKRDLIKSSRLPPRFVETLRSTVSQLLGSLTLEDEGTALVF